MAITVYNQLGQQLQLEYTQTKRRQQKAISDTTCWKWFLQEPSTTTPKKTNAKSRKNAVNHISKHFSNSKFLVQTLKGNLSISVESRKE
jgi:hypothetical protein